MLTTSKNGIALLVDRLANAGVECVVCSPGSRNAPIVIALDLDERIETYVIHDERSAAFYALGMSLQSGNPVALICTSGSAVLNYYPAVAEAYYQCIPLIVMSADRPAEWINHGDGQTIVQKGVFGAHVLGDYEVKEVVQPEDLTNEAMCIDELLAISVNGWKGPVHFNIPVTEPMYELLETEKFSIPREEIKEKGQKEIPEDFLSVWRDSSKRMILVGQLGKNDRLNYLMERLTEDSSVTVLVENTSNLHSHKFIHCIDRTLSALPKGLMEEFEPDVLVSIGGAVVSKRIKAFLRNSKIKAHIKVGFEFPEMDTYRAKTHNYIGDPIDFVGELYRSNSNPSRSNFGGKWKSKDLLMKDATLEYMSNSHYSDLKVFEALLDYLPENCVLHMGNSSVVRYCQLFDPVKSITYYSNRGTSGIDGSLSTACGAALLDPENIHVMISGDVSFFYDSNALWSQYLPTNLRIIVINNSGGGIFRIIDGPSTSPQLEKYFEAKPIGSITKLAEAFGVKAESVHTLGRLEEVLPLFLGDQNELQLIEIETPSIVNDSVLKGFFNVLDTKGNNS